MFQFTLKQLLYIDAAGRLGSIANAAGELNISQSSVTAAIDTFEQRLGYTIFKRMPAKGIAVTPTGRDVLVLVRGFLDQVQHFSSDLASVAGTLTGNLRLACHVTVAPYVIPAMLKNFKRRNPDARVELLEGDTISIAELLRCGDVDLACTYNAMLPQRTRFLPLFETRPFAVFETDHPLAQKPEVSLAELSRMPMIMLDLPMTRDRVLKLFQRHGLEPEIVHSTRSADIVRGLVAAGIGFSILNICSPDDVSGRSGFVCRPIAEDIEKFELGIASLDGVRLPKVVAAFLEDCLTLRDDGGFDHLALNWAALRQIAVDTAVVDGHPR